MTSETPDGPGGPTAEQTSDDTATRRARIETDHGNAATARRVARSLDPDNTDAMETVVEGSRVVTTISRPTTGGLQSTVDDYVVNLQVGAQLTTRDGVTSTNTPDT